MILSKKDYVEKHPNGQLAYHCTWAEIAPMWLAAYPNHRSDKNGKHWVRIGLHRKYFDNGQLAWQLKYDDNGNLIKGIYKAYRKDGTPINH